MLYYQELKDNKAKSVSNLKLFQKKLANCQNYQAEIVDNIDRVKNNMERVRINYQADRYEDILIENIKDEQMDAKVC